MSAIDRLYKKSNYTVQKSINLEDRLYARLKEIVDKDYDATISDMINVCIEDLLSSGSVKYYAKPEDEITIYRSVMIRKKCRGIKQDNTRNRNFAYKISKYSNERIFR